MLYRRPARRPIPPRRPRRAGTGRRRLVLAAAGAVVVAVGAALGVAAATSGGAPGPGPGLPARYEVVYRVANSSSGTAVTTWEVLQADGPFDVADLTYRSDPRAGAPPSGGSVSTFDALYDLHAGRLVAVSGRPPGMGSGAEGLVPELADLRRRGLAVPVGGPRLVAGQRCTTWRFAGPPVGPVARPSGGDHDDLCLSPSGLELAETWTYSGRVVLRRTAVEVLVGRSDPRVRVPAAPAASPPPSAVVHVGLPGPQGSFLAAPPPPPGFSSAGSVGVTAFDPTDTSRVADVSTVWAYRRGGADVTVEAGVGQAPWDDAGVPALSLHLAGLGGARSVLESTGPQIQVSLSGSRWVQIDGSVPLRYLAAYAGRLRLAAR